MADRAPTEREPRTDHHSRMGHEPGSLPDCDRRGCLDKGGRDDASVSPADPPVPERRGTESISEPRTQAGRYLLNALNDEWFTARIPEARRDAILKVESEAAGAATETGWLDRIARAEMLLRQVIEHPTHNLDESLMNDIDDWLHPIDSARLRSPSVGEDAQT